MLRFSIANSNNGLNLSLMDPAFFQLLQTVWKNSLNDPSNLPFLYLRSRNNDSRLDPNILWLNNLRGG